MGQSFLSSQRVYLLGITDENDISDIIRQYTVSSCQCALLFSFREHDALFITLGAFDDLLN